MGLAVVAALCMVLAACGPDVDEVSDGPALEGDLAHLIGEIDGPEEYLFGRISGVAADSQGTIYVADEIASSVRAYTADGGYLGTVGTEGDGPGEFRLLLNVEIDGEGRLLVRGMFRLSVFTRSAASEFADSLVRAVTLEDPRPDRDVPGRVGLGPRYYAPSYAWTFPRRTGHFYLALDSAGRVTDSIPVPPFPNPELIGVANYVAPSGDFGVNVPGINRAPFEPSPSWDVTSEGHVWFTNGDRFELLEVGPGGDTLRVVTRETAPESPSADERADSVEAFLTRLDSVPVSLDDVNGISDMARAREVPNVLPAIHSVQVAADGGIWVRRWPLAPGETRFDVFDSSGAWIAVRLPVSLRANPRPWVSLERVIGVAVDPMTGVERIAVVELR